LILKVYPKESLSTTEESLLDSQKITSREVPNRA
jgi:hypothetical protein